MDWNFPKSLDKRKENPVDTSNYSVHLAGMSSRLAIPIGHDRQLPCHCDQDQQYTSEHVLSMLKGTDDEHAIIEAIQDSRELQDQSPTQELLYHIQRHFGGGVEWLSASSSSDSDEDSTPSDPDQDDLADIYGHKPPPYVNDSQ